MHLQFLLFIFIGFGVMDDALFADSKTTTTRKRHRAQKSMSQGKAVNSVQADRSQLAQPQHLARAQNERQQQQSREAFAVVNTNQARPWVIRGVPQPVPVVMIINQRSARVRPTVASTSSTSTTLSTTSTTKAWNSGPCSCNGQTIFCPASSICCNTRPGCCCPISP